MYRTLIAFLREIRIPHPQNERPDVFKQSRTADFAYRLRSEDPGIRMVSHLHTHAHRCRHRSPRNNLGGNRDFDF